MAVAAGDRHARLRQPELGPDDVDDPLPAVVEPRQPDPEVPAVALERGDHVLGQHVEEGARLLTGRHDVVDRGKRPVGARHRPAARPQGVERLR
jgi:hypothetical protein